jgi:hypothetical protein
VTAALSGYVLPNAKSALAVRRKSSDYHLQRGYRQRTRLAPVLASPTRCI